MSQHNALKLFIVVLLLGVGSRSKVSADDLPHID